MAALAPGVLLKLLSAMETGEKPTGEHRNSLLQVTDIVPAELDFKILWPKEGFYIKVSDSSHSIYVSLPCEQDDLVLSNKLKLGQLIYIEKLEPGSSVPVAKGAKILPGRHPLIGTQEPLLGFGRNGQMINGFGLGTPNKEKGSLVKFDSRKADSKGGNDHSVHSTSKVSFGVGLVSRVETRPESPVAVGKSCIAQTRLKFSRSKSDGERGTKIATIPLNSSGIRRCSTPLSDPRRASVSTNIKESVQKSISSMETQKPQSQSSISVNLSGKLGILCKEVLQQRETAQKIALQALRHATATDNVVRCLKTFSNLSKSAKLDSPGQCFDQFLEFHQQLVQAVTDMVSIQAATDIKTDTTESSGTIFAQNSMDNTCKRSNVRCCTTVGNDENKQPENFGYLRKMIKLGRQIEIEAENWFMDFIEKALETGMMKVSKGRSDFEDGEVPTSLILKVIGWVEAEQNDSRRRQVHSKASQIARKLRIKVKNP